MRASAVETAPCSARARWGSKRLKFLLASPLQYGANEAAEVADSSWPRFIRITDITDEGRLREDTFKSIDPSAAAPYLLRDQDILLARSGATVGKSFLYRDSDGPSAYAGYLIRARLGRDLEPKFLSYFFQSDIYWRWINSILIQATIQNVSAEKYGNLDVPSPTRSDQRQIVSFLDRDTTRIDALIEKKRRLLELLEEKRLAVITHAVTKGLDPSAPMKDSGIDWLGQIPAHWSVRKIKYAVSHVVDCLHTTPHYEGDLHYPAVRTADLDRGRLLLDQARLVSHEVYVERIQRLKPEAGDVLYSREGERFGMAALVPQGIDLCLGQRMMMFRVHSDMNPGYFMWALNSEAIYQQVILFTGGSTSPHINIEDVINFSIPHPPLREQHEILDRIDDGCASIDRIKSKVEDAITKLTEYRAALITNAVTGKIDVREEAQREAAQ